MIKKYVLGLAVLLLPIVAVAAVPTPASALFEGAKQQACDGANLVDSGSDCDDTSKGSDAIQKTIENIINILTIIIGIIAVILIIINGLRFITANGDSGAINNARNGIIYALVGLVIVALAQAIVRFVLNKV